MDEENQIQKLEKTVVFLKKELESQNLAILRLERAFESGEDINKTNERPALTLADMEFKLFGIEEKLKKHNDLIKSIVISLVGVNDLLEELRDFYRNSLADNQLSQEQQMNSLQKVISGSISSLRAEFLLILRDFREKYPLLEEINISNQENDVKSTTLHSVNSPGEIWSQSQIDDLNRRTENLELIIDNNISVGLSQISSSLNYLITKTKELDSNSKEKVKKAPDQPIQ